MSKLNLSDSGFFDGIEKLSEGNIGCATCLTDVFKINKEIDPDSVFGSISSFMLLDTFKIYGEDIYILWDKICSGNSVAFITVLKAVQLGLMSKAELIKGTFDMATVYAEVKESLPSFDPKNRFTIN